MTRLASGLFCLVLLIPGCVADTRSFELRRNESFFRIRGVPSFLLGRNLIARDLQGFENDFRSVAETGETLVRIHLTHGFPNRAAPGEIDESWARHWDSVFDAAARHHLQVLPVFGVWADWNDGSRKEIWHIWDKNRYNKANGGIAASPAELFSDSPARRLWLASVQSLVRRWQSRDNIIAWEIFSELDLVTGSSPKAAAEFITASAAAIRKVDSSRPITASLSGTIDWPEINAHPDLDFLQVHPYANLPRYSGNLADLILDSVRDRLRRYHKPVFIGESGLDARPPEDTLTVSPLAPTGIEHAIWGSIVSGAMNGRMLWWEDGYGPRDLRQAHRTSAATAARFIQSIDFTDFLLLDVEVSANLRGGVIGNDRVILAWFHDTACIAPRWPTRKLVAESFILHATGQWKIQFINPRTGELLAESSAAAQRDRLTVNLPTFEGAIAIKLVAIR